MGKQEKIIEQVRKLFELSKNNPCEEEAKSAACKAQELMMKHHIEFAEVENIDLDKAEAIEEVGVDVPAKKWKYTLAELCGKNFRCQFFLFGKGRIIFFGHKTDAQIAAETFKYLFEMGDKLANRLVREAYYKVQSTKNIYNSFVMGFCAGIREALAEQSKALMVIVPEDVKTQYAERSKGFRTCRTSRPDAYRGDAFMKGREHGYNAMKRNQLEG